jgi:transposase InsO family protein
MPWLETNVREQRMQFIVEATAPDANLSAICRQYGVSRKTGYRWLDRYEAAGSLLGLAERSRRPDNSPQRTSAVRTARIVALRREYGWAGRKLRVLLAAEGVACSTATIDRIIRREGLVDPGESHRPAVTRFERAAPNELWQMDFKGQYPVEGGQWCFPLSVLDDHSRYAVGLFAMHSTEGAPVHTALRGCFERYGLPLAMLVDHGSPWWNAANGHGLTTLSVALIAQGIELIYSGVRHPQTQGKVERFHRTLGHRLRQWGLPPDLAGFPPVLDRFRVEYNEVRPHEATQLRPPATCYTASPRAYVAQPPTWVYPPGLEVLRVDQAGCISDGNRRYFVCQALATHGVGCQRFDQRLLVRYRHLYIREIDLRTGRTFPLLGRTAPPATAGRADDIDGVAGDGIVLPSRRRDRRAWSPR